MTRPLGYVLLVGTIVVGAAAGLLGLHLQADAGSMRVFGTPLLVTGALVALVPSLMVGRNRYLSRRER